VFAIAGVPSGAVSLADGLPYIRDTLRRTTTPHRGSWLIWSVLSSVAFCAQAAQRVTWGLVMLGIQAVLITIIFVLSIRCGEGRPTRTNIAMLVVTPSGSSGSSGSSGGLCPTMLWSQRR